MYYIKNRFAYLFFIIAFVLFSTTANSQNNGARSGAQIVAYGYEFDGDGILCSGETEDLSLTITNIGTEPTSDAILVTLSSSNAWLNIIQDSAIYNGVAPGQLLTLHNGFTIHAAAAINNGQTFHITVTATCGDEVWESEIIITVYKPIVDFYDVSWSGNFTTGGSISVAVSFKNTGGILVTNSTLSLSTSTPNVTINNPEVNIGNLESQGIGSVAFEIFLGLSIPSHLEFTALFSADGGISVSEDFVISNGCNIIIDLHDSYGDGWNYAELNLTFSNGWNSQTYTISSGSEASFTLEMVSNVTVTVSFVSGYYDSECSFEIYYEEGDMIYQSSGTPQEGVITTFTTACGEMPTDCDPISDFSVVAEGTNVVLDWSSTPYSLYEIRRDGVLIATETNTHYTDINVNHGEHYYCVSSVCNEDLSNPVCEFATIYAPCVPPENVLTAIQDNYSVYISWAAAEDAQKYKVYRNNEEIGITTKTFYYDLDLGLGTYCYNIVSVCAIDESGMSEEACAEMINPDCEAPNNLTATTVDRNISLSWEPILDADSYNVYRGSEQIAAQITETSFVDPDLANGTYCYTVTSVCTNQEESLPSNESCNDITSIEELQADFKVYPNPVQSLLTIEGANIKTVSVFNIIGQQIESRVVSTEKITIDLQSYATGTYLLKILTQSGFEVTKRIVVSK